MSIENNLESIAKSLASIAKSLDHLGGVELPTATLEKEAVKKEKASAKPEAVVVQPVTEMPATPDFMTQPVNTAPVGVKAPFTTTADMTNYIMTSYQALGPTVGANIQKVLADIGVKNVNEITPDKYDALYAGVEALKS